MLALFAGASSQAATIVATPSASTIAVGEQASIEITIVLSDGEDASVFEGHFGVSSPGAVRIDPAGFGSTWATAFPNTLLSPAPTAVMSLTSLGNRSDHTLLGTLLIEATQVGVLSLTLDSPTTLERDLASAPFFEGVPLANALGSSLAEITVIPEPANAVLLGIGLAALTRLGRR